MIAELYEGDFLSDDQHVVHLEPLFQTISLSVVIEAQIHKENWANDLTFSSHADCQKGNHLVESRRMRTTLNHTVARGSTSRSVRRLESGVLMLRLESVGQHCGLRG